MTYRVRNVLDTVVATLVKAHNDERRAQIAAEVHYGKTGADVTGDPRDPVQVDLVVASADASDLPTLLTVTNEIKIVYTQHIDDLINHDLVDTANAIAAADATDLATAQTLLNELKADYNLHRAQANIHPNNDSGNEITAADASDQGTAQTLANELKADLNLHMAAALVGEPIQLVSP